MTLHALRAAAALLLALTLAVAALSCGPDPTATTQAPTTAPQATPGPTGAPTGAPTRQSQSTSTPRPAPAADPTAPPRTTATPESSRPTPTRAQPPVLPLTQEERDCTEEHHQGPWQDLLEDPFYNPGSTAAILHCLSDRSLILLAMSDPETGEPLFSAEATDCLAAGTFAHALRTMLTPSPQHMDQMEAAIIAVSLDAVICLSDDEILMASLSPGELGPALCLAENGLTGRDVLQAYAGDDPAAAERFNALIDSCPRLMPLPPAHEPPPKTQAAAQALADQRASELGTVLTPAGWERTTWPDASLGCPRQGHFYAQVATPGFAFTYTGQLPEHRTTVHTNAEGTSALIAENCSPATPGGSIHPGPGPGEAQAEMSARATAAAHLGAPDPDELALIHWQETTWPNGCRGCAGPADVCTQALVPGFVAIYLHPSTGRTARVHTDQDGWPSFVPSRCEPSPPLTGD